jgi:hypothetical protein
LRNSISTRDLGIFAITVFLFYFFFQLIFNYWLGILALIDRKKNDYETNNYKIVDVKIEDSWSGWLWHSIIPKFYPKKLDVKRYKIICIDELGKLTKVRSVMSREKKNNIGKLFIWEYKVGYAQINYCKHTKILLSLELSEKYQLKTYKPKEQTTIISLLNKINTQI